MKKAGRKNELARFGPAFRKSFPAKRK